MDIMRKKQRILTKRVNPDWYRRYAKILTYEERIFLQPLREIREEDAMLKALMVPPSEDDRAMELARKLSEARSRKIKLVLHILEGNLRHLDLSSLKPSGETPLSAIGDEPKAKTQTLFWREKAVRPPDYVLSRRSKWRLFWENPLIMKKFQVLVQLERSRKVHAKWRKAIRLVRCIHRFTDVVASIARTTDDVFKKFRETSERDNKGNFQKNYFKATAVGKNLGVNTLFTLTKPMMYRTEEQAHEAAKSLRVIQAFAEFPVNLQDKIGSIAWYLELERDKVIIREGQPANSFYFLLAGRVAAVKIDGKPWKSHVSFKAISTHTMGDLLGEEGIGSRKYREYSLCTVEKCKIISVSIDDYNRACLIGETDDANPEHISFLSQLAFMKFFPMKQLVDNAMDNILLFYYRPGSVITKNTAESEYIYIVFKGVCKVMAEINRKGKFTKKVLLPPIDQKKQCSREDSLLSMSSKSTTPARSNSFLRGIIAGKRQSSDRSQSVDKRHSVDKRLSVDKRHSVDKRRSLDRRHSYDKRHSAAHKTYSAVDKLTKVWGRRTIADSIKARNVILNMNLAGAGSIEKCVLTKQNPIASGAEWVLLKMLREGDVIGLENLDLGEVNEISCAKTAVVSEGAEVILVLKEFFLQNASPLLKSDLRASSYIFPDENHLKAELNRRLRWKRYQNGVMEEMYGEKERDKKNRVK